MSGESHPEPETVTTPETTTPAVPVEPRALPDDAGKRLDLLVLSQNSAFNMVDHGLRALMNFMHTGHIGRATNEALAKDWQEIYLVPGATAHEAFVRHAWDMSINPFVEIVVHNSLKMQPIPFGGEPGQAARFWIEFRGCLFEEFDGRFKNRLHNSLNTRTEIITRPFTSLPHHLEVPHGEELEVAKRHGKDRTSPRVGTAVEEF